MSRGAKVAAVLILAALAIAFYMSPDDDYLSEPLPSDAIETAVEFATQLFLGNKERMADVAAVDIRDSILNLRIEPLSEQERFELFEGRQVNWSFFEPLDFDQTTEGRLRVYSLCYYGRYAVVTLALAEKSSSHLYSVKGMGPIAFTILLSYRRPGEDPSFRGIVRKIENMALVRHIRGRLATSARWQVEVYAYRSTQRQYAEWLSAHGESLTRRIVESNEAFADSVHSTTHLEKYQARITQDVGRYYETIIEMSLCEFKRQARFVDSLATLERLPDRM